MGHRDVQRPLGLARAIGLLIAALLVAAKDWPGGPELGLDPGVSEQTAWLILGAVAVGSLVLWGWARGAKSGMVWINAFGFVLDAALVYGTSWIFAPASDAWFTLLPFAVLSGALRFRWVGAGIGVAATAVFLVALFEILGGGFEPEPFVFAVAVCIAFACVAASVSTNWHKRQQEFELQASRLVELDRLKDRYIAVTTHEIRGPLSAMISAIDTVKMRWDKIDPERREHLLEMVYLQGRELDRLVQDLFISAEVQSGGLQLQPEWVELEPILKRAVDAASSKRRGHLLELFVDPLRVELDPYRVSQIIRNLVENAYKYTPDRTRVLVSAKGVSDGIQLEVLDHGDGIPPGKRDLLFEAFSRIEETAAGQEGVGLGLYVVSQLVAAMNGRIDLQSSSRGTIFSIFIPCPTASLDRRHIGLVGGDEATHG